MYTLIAKHEYSSAVWAVCLKAFFFNVPSKLILSLAIAAIFHNVFWSRFDVKLINYSKRIEFPGHRTVCAVALLPCSCTLRTV